MKKLDLNKKESWRKEIIWLRSPFVTCQYPEGFRWLTSRHPKPRVGKLKRDKFGKERSRLRVVPHFPSGIVERAERKRAWKSPHARKDDTRQGERKMRDYRQSPSFWTNALLSQRKTLIGSSMEICQHLSKTRQPLSTLDIITICRTNN